jgi:valyl-tRNA synthetase
MALYSYAAPGRDAKASRQTMDERCKNFRNFATKLRNINRFIMELQPENAKKELNFSHADDKQIKERFEITHKEVTKHLDEFNFHLAVDTAYNFVWHEFADEYIEKTKDRRAEAQPVLAWALKNILILLHPFMPFTTEDIYQKSFADKKSLMLESWQ